MKSLFWWLSSIIALLATLGVVVGFLEWEKVDTAIIMMLLIVLIEEVRAMQKETPK